jgi:hypothetical protein
MGQVGRQGPERVLVGQLGSRVGERVRVCGWVQTLRLQRRMQFVVLGDESGAVQLTNRREVRPGLDRRIDALTVGSAVALTGRVVEAPQVKLGGIEVLVDSFDQVSIAEQPLPIAGTSNPDLRLDWRFLDLRTPRQHLIFKVGDLFEQRMRSFLLGRGFTELHTPKLMGGRPSRVPRSSGSTTSGRPPTSPSRRSSTSSWPSPPGSTASWRSGRSSGPSPASPLVTRPSSPASTWRWRGSTRSTTSCAWRRSCSPTPSPAYATPWAARSRRRSASTWWCRRRPSHA